MSDRRRTEQALAWAADMIGGRIVRQEQSARWRPMWELDIERPDGTVVATLLRGFRAAGVTEDEAASRNRLRLEAGLYEALQGTGVKLAHYYGHEPDGGWFLMERLTGDVLLSKLTDVELQDDLFGQYMENVALMHNLDYRQLDLPDDYPIAPSHEAAVSMYIDWGRREFAALSKKDPEPALALGDWFMSAHLPAPAGRFSVTTGDIGPDQFFFADGQYKAMFDIEYGYVGDPLQDIGLMRLRTMCYPINDLPSHIHTWAKLVNRELDRVSVAYWTMAAMTVSPWLFYPQIIDGDPQMIADSLLMHAANPIYRRGVLETLAEFYDIELPPVEQPVPDDTRLSRVPKLLARQVREHHVPESKGRAQFHLECSAAFAESAVLSNTIGPKLLQDNIDDLATVLGHRPASETEGLAELEQRIADDPERDLDKVVPVLHRIEVRSEFLLAPIQKQAGFASGIPMQRLW